MNEPDIGYIVLERTYEDNGDGVYCKFEGGNPVRFFWDCEKAQQFAIKKNAKKFKSIDLTSYGYELDEITDKNSTDVQKALREIGIDWEGCYEELYIPRRAMSMEKIVKIFNLIEFFYVEEVEVEE